MAHVLHVRSDFVIRWMFLYLPLGSVFSFDVVSPQKKSRVFCDFEFCAVTANGIERDVGGR